MASFNQSYFNVSDSTFLDQSILDVFVLQNLISQEDAAKLKQKLKTNRQIEEFLLRNHVVTKDTTNKAYSIILKLPYIELKNVKIPNDLKKIVNEKNARKYGIIAFSQDEGMIRIATSRPADILTGFKTGLKTLFDKNKLEVELFITGETDFLNAIKQYRDNSMFLLSKGSLPVVYLRNQPIEPQYLEKFQIEFIEKYRLVVFGQNQKGHYLIACEQPDSPVTIKILDFIKRENGVKIEQFSTSTDDIDSVLQRIKEKKRVDSKKNINDQNNTKLVGANKQITSGQTGSLKNLLNSLMESNQPEVTIDEVESVEESNVPIKTGHKIDDIPIKKEISQDKQKVEANTDYSDEIREDKELQESIKGRLDSQPEGSKIDDKNLGSLIKEDVVDQGMLQNIIKEGYIPKMMAAVINFALLKHASDIHIEPESKTLRVRCRVDGVLQDMANMPLENHPPLVSRVKIMSKLKIDESRIPQDGRFDVTFKDREVDVRVSTLPTVHGEKVVMRILDKSQGILSLEDLGMQGSAFEQTNLAIKKPYGIILSAGPTGSGKSTTLYAVLNRISLPGVNIVTLEDPVEYEIPGINQCQIKPEIGFTFASGLRSILRQDPNVIMVGEIRDTETANMATHAALTGHLVLSTLHTNDTAGALPRLINMGVEPFLITSSINLVIAQRLVRRVCVKCREEVRIPQKLMDQLKQELERIPSNAKDRIRIPSQLKLYHGKGCPECNHGFTGRIGIFEVMTITPAIEELAIAKRPANEIKEMAIKEGMITMKQDGILKAFAGLTTVDEVFQAAVNS